MWDHKIHEIFPLVVYQGVIDCHEQFKKDNYPLFLADLIEWEGFIFINLSDNPSEFKLEYKPIINRFSEWEINNLEIYESKVYHINCNWKLIIQNVTIAL